MAKNATRKQKVESMSETIRTSDGQVLMLTVACEPVQRVAREKFPTLREQMRAHLAKMAEVTNA
jgi:ribosomal protein S3AE